MRPNESLILIGAASLSILSDMRDGKNVRLSIAQLCKRSGLTRKHIYQQLEKL